MEQNGDPRNKSIYIHNIYIHIHIYKYNQPMFDRGAKNTQLEKDSLFNKQCWENRIIPCKWVKLEPYLTLFTNINPKWVTDLNVKIETIKFWMWNEKQNNKRKNQHVGPHQLKSFFTGKETTDKMKRQATKGEKIFANRISHKALISNI